MKKPMAVLVFLCIFVHAAFIQAQSNNTINDIAGYIYNDLNIRSLEGQNNINRFIEAFNIEGSNTITKTSSPNRHYKEVLDDYYTITSDIYKIVLVTNIMMKKFIITSINIVINQENYLRLFPYQTMNEYLTDNNFGRIRRYDQNRIIYWISDDEWVLVFRNGLLHSIIFWPHLT